MKKIIGIICLFVVCGFLCACDASHEGVAARVENRDITEDKVTQTIQHIRQANNLIDDEVWKKYLADNNTSSKKYRDTILDKLIDNEISNVIAQRKGIEVSDEELNKQVQLNISFYGGEAAFQQQLQNNGESLDQFKEELKQDLTNQMVSRQLVQEAEVTDTTMGRLFINYGSKLNGSTGYYQIIFPQEDTQKATATYNQITSGKISFEEATKQITASDSTKVNFDYINYDCFISNPEPAKTRLTQLNIGDISEIIHTDKYLYIFKVVDKIHCSVPLPSLSELSDFTQENIRNYAKIRDSQNIYKDTFESEKKKMNIKKYPAPDDLPY